MSNSRIHLRPASPPASDPLDAIGQFDTCTIANAIERFGVRLRNEGFTRPGMFCVTGGMPRILGYAATCRVRSSDPPMTGGSYLDRTDWWDAIENLPVPRIAVIQDLDDGFSLGSCVGEVHASLLRAFGCVGLLTNGAVRDLPAVSELGFPMFARAAAVSHSYSHLVDYGTPVEVFGLRVRCGDLLAADCHGAISIPLEIVEKLPKVAADIREQEQAIVEFCRSPGFSREQLRRILGNQH